MSKTRKRFVIFATLCVFVLLFVLLGIINGVNFTMASGDADQLTEMLAQQQATHIYAALLVTLPALLLSALGAVCLMRAFKKAE